MYWSREKGGDKRFHTVAYEYEKRPQILIEFVTLV